MRARLERIDPRRRPCDRPWERLTLLVHQARHRLSNAATDKAFMVSVQAVVSWHRDAAQIVRSRVESRTPLKRASVLVAALVVRLKAEWPNGGTRRVAGMLAPLGIAAWRSTNPTLASIRMSLRAYAPWFNAHRPHPRLGQRTSDEV